MPWCQVVKCTSICVIPTSQSFIISSHYLCFSDLMADILSGLSIKCSKHKVLQKMIELGLIENARQVKGVRMRKSGGRGEEGGRRKAGGGTSCWENTGRADDFIDTTDDSSSDGKERLIQLLNVNIIVVGRPINDIERYFQHDG